MTSEVDVVLRAGAINGECPVWSAAEGVLYWTDTMESALHRFDPRSGRDERWAMPASLGSFGLGRAGRLLLALRTGLYRFAPASAALELLAPAPFDPRRLTWNDGKTDPWGRFWVGPMFQPLERAGTGATSGPLCRIELDGTVRAHGAPVAISNGLAWSADGRTMYHADTARAEIYAYDVLDGPAGALGERRTFASVPVPGGAGGPDGGATDAEGCYWSAIYGGGRLVRFDPAGRIEREVRLPVPNPTMLAFGGPALRTAYVTTAAKPLDAQQRAAQPLHGALFAFEAPAPGVAVPLLDERYFG